MSLACWQAAVALPALRHDVSSNGSSAREAACTAVLVSEFLGRRHNLRISSQRTCSAGADRSSVSYIRASYSTNGWAAPQSTPSNARYQRVGECLVFPQLPKSKKPKGIIKFLGGAFIGASPDVTYRYFIELLAKEGYVIVATPYNVTFDHAVSALKIHQKFNNTLNTLLDSGCSIAGLSPEDISKLQVYSVGHSNGALMQILIGSLMTEGQLPKANVIISFNNKPAADAVPIFDQMGPAMQQAAPILQQASPFTKMATNFAAEAFKAAKDVSIPLPPGIGKDDLQSIQEFFEQIPGVFDQVSEGVSEFKPTPAENRATIAIKYAVPNNLLIKFTDDTIDESDLVEDALRSRSNLLGGTFKKSVVTGTHATPLAQDLKWQVGSVYSPIDAVAQVVKYAALADLRSLARNIADFLDTVY